MPLTPAQLVAPVGELEEYMFPDGTLQEKVDAYLAEGYARAAGLAEHVRDDAAQAWVYYRAFKAFVAQVTMNPARVTLDSGKTASEFTSEQIKDLVRQRDRWLAEYQGFFTTSSVGVAVAKIKDPTPKNLKFI